MAFCATVIISQVTFSSDEKRKALERLTMLRKEEKEGVAIKAKVAKYLSSLMVILC